MEISWDKPVFSHNEFESSRRDLVKGYFELFGAGMPEIYISKFRSGK